jgi:arylsulfatase A-like enzyme
LIVSSDNGGVGGYQELGIKARPITSNAPLRGGKGMLYEGGIRVPLIVRWPGKVKPGTRCKTPVTSVDFYPTLLETAGAPRPSGQILDGQSIVPLLKQTKDLNRDAIFWHFPAYLQATGGTWRTTPVGVVRKGDWKLLEFFEDGHLELYNLKDDISEKNNLAEQKPKITADLHKLLKNWRKFVGARVPIKPNPKYNPNRKRA